jgi:hypothetical protein
LTIGRYEFRRDVVTVARYDVRGRRSHRVTVPDRMIDWLLALVKLFARDEEPNISIVPVAVGTDISFGSLSSTSYRASTFVTSRRDDAFSFSGTS